MVKVVAFNGSPRKGGNSQLLLEEAVRGVKEAGADATVFHLNTLNLKACQHCGQCDNTGMCVIRDDMQAIHESIRDADRIVLASPIFFFTVSAQAKLMIDRCQAFWAQKYVHKNPVPPGPFGRKGLLILVGGMAKGPKNHGFECAEVTARAFFRTVNVQEHTTLAYGLIEERGAIREHPTALREAYDAGVALAR